MVDDPLNFEDSISVLQLSGPTACQMEDCAVAESSRSQILPQTMLMKMTELLKRNESTDEADEKRQHSLADNKEDSNHHDPWSLSESSDIGPNWSGNS